MAASGEMCLAERSWGTRVAGDAAADAVGGEDGAAEEALRVADGGAGGAFGFAAEGTGGERDVLRGAARGRARVEGVGRVRGVRRVGGEALAEGFALDGEPLPVLVEFVPNGPIGPAGARQ